MCVGGYPGKSKALGFEEFGDIGELVDFLAGEGACRAFDVDRAHTAARLNRALENGEFGVFQQVGQIDQLKAETGVRFIRAEAFHGLPPGEAAQRKLKVAAENLPEDPLHQSFVDRLDIDLIDKGHLEIDLGEFRLAVGAQILVAEAAGNLKVAVKAREHRKLLVELW